MADEHQNPADSHVASADMASISSMSHPWTILRIFAGTHQYWTWSTADARPKRESPTGHYALPIHGIAANFSRRRPAETYPRKVAFHLTAPHFVSGARRGASAPQCRHSDRARGELQRGLASLAACPTLLSHHPTTLSVSEYGTASVNSE